MKCLSHVDDGSGYFVKYTEETSTETRKMNSSYFFFCMDVIFGFFLMISPQNYYYVGSLYLEKERSGKLRAKLNEGKCVQGICKLKFPV